jgi:uncharacterized oligopeptide transporter (OPT) family protein
MDTNRYESARKHAPRKNPVVLGALATAWVYWVGVAAAIALLVGALSWMLLNPLVAPTNKAPSVAPAAAASTPLSAHNRE